MRQPGADEVGLERDVGELRAAIRRASPATSARGTRAGPSRRGSTRSSSPVCARAATARHGDDGGHEQAESEREQEEALRGHWATSVPDLAPNDNRGGSLERRGIRATPRHAGRRDGAGRSARGGPDRVLRRRELRAGATGSRRAVPFCPLPAELRAEHRGGVPAGPVPGCDGGHRGQRGASRSWTAPRSRGRRRRRTRRPRSDRVLGARRERRASSRTGPDSIRSPRRWPRSCRLRPTPPQVRAGVAVDGVGIRSTLHALVVVIAWKGVGTAAFEASESPWRSVRNLTQRGRGHARQDRRVRSRWIRPRR